MKFRNEDHGNARVYYTNVKLLICWRDEGSWGREDWKLYQCSKDGEPSHPIHYLPGDFPLPPGETRTGRQLARWLLNHHIDAKPAAAAPLAALPKLRV